MAHVWPALVGVLLGGRSSSFGSSSSGSSGSSGTAVGQLADMLGLDDHIFWMGVSTLYWLVGVAAFVALSYATNPSDVSFRTHLTSLSFHLHLRRLRENQPSSSSDGKLYAAPGSFDAVAGAENGNAYGSHFQDLANGNGKATRDASGTSTPANGHSAISVGTKRADHSMHTTVERRPYLLNYNSRVTISLRSPVYSRTSFGLFSVARILAGSSNAESTHRQQNSKLLRSSTGRKLRTGSINNRKGVASAENALITQLKARAPRLAALLTTSMEKVAAANPFAAHNGFFIGMFGYWWTIDDGTSLTGQRERLRLEKAITSIDMHEDDEVAHVPESIAPSNLSQLSKSDALEVSGEANILSVETGDRPASVTGHNAGAAGTRQKAMQRISVNNANGITFRGGQRRSSPTPRAIGQVVRSKKAGNAELSPTSETASTVAANTAMIADVALLGISRPLSIGANGLLSQKFGVTTPARDSDAPITSGATDMDADTGSKDALSAISFSASAGEASIAAASQVCVSLQGQLDDARESGNAVQAKLEQELEELRARKRDEDLSRGDLRSRTKGLEEGKRSAEQERFETEKRLIAVRSNKKTIEERVSKAKAELTKLEKREKEADERIRRLQEERQDKLNSLRHEVKHKEELLAKEQDATERLAQRVEVLETEIQDRRSELQNLREEAGAAARQRLNSSRAVAAAAAANVHRSYPTSATSPNLSHLYDRSSAEVNGSPNFAQRGDSDQPMRASTPPVTYSSFSPSTSDLQHDFGYAGPSLDSRLEHVRSSTGLAVYQQSATMPSSLQTDYPDDKYSALRPIVGYSPHADHSPHSPGYYAGSFSPFGPISPVANGFAQTEMSPSIYSSEYGSVAAHAAFDPAPGRPLHHSNSKELLSGTQAGLAYSPSQGGSFDFLNSEGNSPVSTGILETVHRLSPLGATSMQRASSQESDASSATSGPLSPMTPHQASLIPSRLFDMLDDVDIPGTISPGSPTRQISGMGSRVDDQFAAFASDIDNLLGDEPRFSAFPQHYLPTKSSAFGPGDVSPASQHSRRFSTAGQAAWDSVDDVALSKQSQLSRNVSLTKPSPSVNETQVSSSLLNLHNASSHNTPAYTSGAPLSKISSNSANQQVNPGGYTDATLLDKARAALALNPDAKAFSFSKPLPGGNSSTASPHMSAAPSSSGANSADASRLAFEGASNTLKLHSPGVGTDTSSNRNATGHDSSTWVSPGLKQRGLPGNNAAWVTDTSVTGSSRPNQPSSTSATGGAFSPFGDDHLPTW